MGEHLNKSCKERCTELKTDTNTNTNHQRIVDPSMFVPFP